MSDEIVHIVDRDDNIIGIKRRIDLTDGDIIRVSSLWLEDGNGNVLLQQRAFTKKDGPGKWQPAVAGTVEVGESYLENIIKETEEEIGLKNFVPTVHAKRFLDYGDLKNRRIVMYYTATCDQPIEYFTPEEGQIEELKWMNKDELFDDIEANPEKYVRSASLWRELFY